MSIYVGNIKNGMRGFEKMTDRAKGFTVVLSEDIRIDERVKNEIRQDLIEFIDERI